VVQAARAAPTKCSVCGATITQVVVKGMTEIKCEYCGNIIRL
jgi:DNA-directed RNA polymerase subunit RPC12/RpoP